MLIGNAGGSRSEPDITPHFRHFSFIAQKRWNSAIYATFEKWPQKMMHFSGTHTPIA